MPRSDEGCGPSPIRGCAPQQSLGHRPDEVEVAVLVWLAEVGNMPLIDPVGGDDDPAPYRRHPGSTLPHAGQAFGFGLPS
jgi:hypothetical protein